MNNESNFAELFIKKSVRVTGIINFC